VSKDDPEDDNEILHYEGGLPVFNARLEKVERKQEGEEARYKNVMYFTGALVICSVLSGGVSAYQAHVARLNATAASDNAIAAKSQADAAKAQADSAKAQVDEMKKSGTDTHDLAEQAESQTKLTSRLTENARESLINTQSAFRDDQRAWVGIGIFRVVQFETEKPIKIEVQIKNTGKTPALHIEEWLNFKFSSIAEIGPLAMDMVVVPWRPQGSTPPQGDQTIHIEIPWELWKRASGSMSMKRAELSIFGEIGYDDVSNRPHTTQVRLHMPDSGTRELFFCDRWNDMN
jgi:hypothetical protein